MVGRLRSLVLAATLAGIAAIASPSRADRDLVRDLFGERLPAGMSLQGGHAGDAAGIVDLPVPRYLASTIYDPVGERLILFGGIIGGELLNDVWALSLYGAPIWTRLTVAGAPPSPRASHTAIYDPVRQRMIVFGGYDPGRRNDVWSLTLSGTPEWSALSPGVAVPPPRNLHSAVYDPVRDRMIVFGGYGELGFLSDTWALPLADGQAWAQLSPGGQAPEARRQHIAIYDPVRDRMVIGGGQLAAGGADDLWALTLAGSPAWTRLSPVGGAFRRDSHSAIYDPVGDRMIVFGGSDMILRADTWMLSLGGAEPAWSRIDPTTPAPPPRSLHGAIYDPAHRRMVVFGGIGNTIELNDTWALSLEDAPIWYRIEPVEALPVTPIPSFAQPVTGIPESVFIGQEFTLSIAVRNDGLPSDYGRIVVSFPGLTDPADSARVSSPSSGDTPGYREITDGATYPDASCLPVTLPYLFTEYADDNWGGHGNEVNTLSLTVRPSAVGVFHVDVRSVMHIVGGTVCEIARGRPAGTAATDTLRWEVTRYAVTVLPIPQAGPPPGARSEATAILDPVRDRMVVFGGDAGGLNNETWTLSLSDPTWSLLVPAGTPPSARSGHSAIYDPVRDRMLVFGGSDGSRRDDVWALSLADPPTWTRLTPLGAPPPPRQDHSAIYDPVRDRMIVYGGLSPSGERNDVWALALAGVPTWGPLVPSGAIAPQRRGHGAVYDPARDRMLVYGGTRTQPYGDVMSLQLNGPPVWTVELSPIPGYGPTPRAGHAMVYDPSRDRVWVVGGDSGTLENDAWTLTPAGVIAWTRQLTWATPMPRRRSHTAILDPVRDRLVMFGGAGEAFSFNDTWFLSLPVPPMWEQLDGVPPPPRPTGPIPIVSASVAGNSTSIVYGQTITLTVGARNDGLRSDDGRIVVSFPSLNDPADGQWVSSLSAGDAPGYREWPAGATLINAACQPVITPYLVAEYADVDWDPLGTELNVLTVTVRPRATGTFHLDVRSTMHRAGGVCTFVNGVPAEGQGGVTDPLGWEVRRFAVTVNPGPVAPEPVFTAAVNPIPSIISLGQTFAVTISVRNDGATSDDGRIVIGFPSLTSPTDHQFVSSPSTGDLPGYRETPATLPLLSSSCQVITASYLAVEYVDQDWQWLGEETNTLTVIVQPPARGLFYFDVRSTLHTILGGPCGYVTRVPPEAEASVVDQQGWGVARYEVRVLPGAPDPAFSGVIIDPGPSITLGQTFALTATVTNAGSPSDDARIVVSFPAFTLATDTDRVSSQGLEDDYPGYREMPVGTTITRSNCTTMVAPYLSVEYADDAWQGGNTETNQLIVQVQPREVGTFTMYVRSTMHWAGGETCDIVNTRPGGTQATDAQGWTVTALTVYVGLPPPPEPVFAGAIVGLPSTIELGENFRITMTVRNDGAAASDGQITLGFPALDDPTHSAAVASATTGDLPGYVEHPAGAPIGTATCQTVAAGYLVVEYMDASWSAGESNTFSLIVQPQRVGTFAVDIRATIRLTPEPCDYVVGLPEGGVGGATDQQGWAVQRFVVDVRSASGVIGEPTTDWAPIIPPLGGPSPRTGATAIYHPLRDAMIIYGGADPVYRGDVWQLPLTEGSAWVPLAPGGPVPQRRIMHSTVYNSRDDQSVIFGGFYDDFLSDMTVLSFSGQLWWFPNPGYGAPPPARGGHAAIYDPVRHRMLVIGGYDGTLRDDVWEYAPPGVGEWRQLSPVSGPFPARAQHAAIYDPVRDRILIIGGDGGTLLNDLWALNLSGTLAWQQLYPNGTPPSARREHTAIYDPVGDRVIVYGGFDGARRGDLWELTLSGAPTWQRLFSASVSPGSRYGHVAVYDGQRRRMVIFGGHLGTQELGADAWTLQLDYSTPVTVALASVEATPERVRLAWTFTATGPFRTEVSRALEGSEEWLVLGSASVEGDRLLYEDRGVEPGQRYGYRLTVWEGSEAGEVEAAWVTVPRPAVLSLAGAFPNPSEGELEVGFSLAGAEAASLELFDLKGRRVAAQEVGALGPGEHRLRIEEARGLPAGVYLVRLTQQGRKLTTKACIVR